jgi:hypothetical protein
LAQGGWRLGAYSLKSDGGGIGLERLAAQLIPPIIAVGSIATFYAHNLLQRPAAELTPIITFGIAIALATSALFGALTLRSVSSPTPARRFSALLLSTAIFFQFVSCIDSWFHGPPSIEDWGIFVIEIATPVFLIFSPHRVAILRLTLKIAVFFAFGDLFFNATTYAGLSRLSDVSGSYNSSYGVHYLGIPGNSFAEGIVAFLAISYISSGLPNSTNKKELFFRILLLLLLFLSEILIRARSDLAISIVAAALLSFRKSHHFPMILVSVSISILLLYATFHHNPYDTDESLRANLMRHGISEASHNILLGEGPRYRPTADLVANFRILSSAGITESGTIDYVTAYGALSTVLMYLSLFFALAASRSKQTIEAVLLACLSGSLVINGGLSSFLGSIIFYDSLVICQREEWWLLKPRLPLQ